MPAYYNEFDPFAAEWLKKLIDKNLIAKGDVDVRSITEIHPDDLKGKGEPSFTIEKALKDHKRLGDTGTEMTSRSHRTRSVGHAEAPGIVPSVATDPEASGVGRSNTTGRSVGGAIRKRIGSIRRRKQEVEV